MKIKSEIEQPHQGMELWGYRCLSTDKFGRMIIKVTVLQNALNCQKPTQATSQEYCKQQFQKEKSAEDI